MIFRQKSKESVQPKGKVRTPKTSKIEKQKLRIKSLQLLLQSSLSQMFTEILTAPFLSL